MDINIKKLKNIFCIFAAVLPVVLFSHVNAAAEPAQELFIPIELNVVGDDGNELEGYEEERFGVRLTADTKDAPMPSGSEGGSYAESFTPGINKLFVAFTDMKAGDYGYTVRVEEKEGFVCSSSYDVLVRINPEGYAQVAAYNEVGEKSLIDFVIYKKGQPDAPSYDQKVKDFVDVSKEPENSETFKTDERAVAGGSEAGNDIHADTVTNGESAVKERVMAQDKTSYGKAANAAKGAPTTGDRSVNVYYVAALAAAFTLGVAAYGLVRAKRRQ